MLARNMLREEVPGGWNSGCPAARTPWKVSVSIAIVTSRAIVALEFVNGTTEESFLLNHIYLLITKRVSCWYNIIWRKAGTRMVKKEEARPEPKRISIDKDLVEPQIPLALLGGPSIPDGMKEGWFLERPPLMLFARILPDAEAKKVHWTVYPSRGDEGYKDTMDYESTIIELLLKNTGPSVFKTDKQRDYKMRVSTFDNPSERIDASNYNASGSAKNWLGKDNVLTHALDQDAYPIEIPPGGSLRWLNYFTNYAPTKSLVPEKICRVYVGDWPMWPVHRPVPPPGVKVPAEGIIKLTAYRRDQNDPHYGTPEDIVIARGVLHGTSHRGPKRH
jgi:hypothetical protein